VGACGLSSNLLIICLPENSLSCSQDPTSGDYTEQVKSSQHTQGLSLKIYFNFIITSLLLPGLLSALFF
jgi:hypothetical protein